jgi:phage N-6-adenine-methyltransferase
MAKTQPEQKPHRSKQNYRTPSDFFGAANELFGPFELDLAAVDGTLCRNWLGPGSELAEDSLSVSWIERVNFLTAGRPAPVVCWLNPPFADIRPWARKCAQEASRDRRIVMLTPSSLGAEWYCDAVQGHALTLVVRPRITFVGCDDPYPKDLAIHLFGFRMVGIGTWRWK